MKFAALSRRAACGGRALIVAAALFVCAAGLVGGASATTPVLCTTTIAAPTATPSTVTAGTSITYTATVTASSGCPNGSPTGAVEFYSNYTGQTPVPIGHAVTLTPSGTSGQSTATLADNSLPAGSYAVTASYTSNNEALFYDSGPSVGTNIVVQGVNLNNTTISIIANPTSISVGNETVTFTVKVTAVDNNGNPISTIPTGNVEFSVGPTLASGQTDFGSAALDNTGTATITKGLGLQSGTYYVLAGYQGDKFDRAVTGSYQILVAPAGGTQPIPTTTTTSASPGTIAPGGTTTATAHVVESATGSPAPPAGGQVQFFVGPDPTHVNTYEGSASTDANGNASLSFAIATAGTWTVRAQYIADTRNSAAPVGGSSGDTSLTVQSQSQGGGTGTGTGTTQVTSTGPFEAAFGTTVTLSANLAGSGAPLAGKQLTLTIGSQSCTTPATAANGNASCQISLTQAAGAHPFTAAFAGDSSWSSSSYTDTFAILTVPTSTTYTGDTTVGPGATATLSATLANATTNAPIPGETVAFTLGAETCSMTTNAGGNASCTVTVGEGPGTYPVVATFTSDGNYETSSDSADFTVTAESTSLSTDDVEADAGSTTTFSATLTDEGSGEGIAGQTIAIAAGSQTCTTGATDSTGTASCDITLNQPAGSYPITATFPGTTSVTTSTASATLSVDTITTTTTYAGVTSGANGVDASVDATLTDDSGNPISGKTLTFTIGSQQCSGVTDSSGYASCTITIDQAAGAYSVVTTFAGDGDYLTSGDTEDFTIAAESTSLFTDDVEADAGSTTTFSATLTDEASGDGISGQTITIVAGSQTCTTGATDSTGTASCDITLNQPAGSYPITATFAGNASVTTSTASATLTADAVATTTTYTGSTGGVVGATATLSATLTDDSGNPVSGETLAFQLGSKTCNAATTASGNASCTVTVTAGAGTVTATFAGDDVYETSSDSADFAVASASTTIAVTPVSPVLAGSVVSLSGTLKAGSAPLAGKTLTLSLGSKSCTAVTGSNGKATCSVTESDAAGLVALKAVFAGDSLYSAASDSQEAIVYGLAPGGGSFVVGNNTATGSVTFWGAKWSKVNVLTGGSAPASFKGFALTPSAPQCGATWTTGPGNSSSPPAGPLPAYMAVAVTSAVIQAGSTIYGNTVAIVIVQTSSGYKNDPGHAGTGTVVGTICTGSATIAKPGTTTTYTGATSGAAGSTATLSATLTDAFGNALANEVVTLAAGSESCTAKTDAKGNASCPITISLAAGTTYPVTATFAGDSTFAGSSASATFAVTSQALNCNAKTSHCESLLADPSPDAGATVLGGQTLSIVYMDDAPISTSIAPTAVLSTGQSLPVTLKSTSGQPSRYVDSNGGSTSSKYQSLLTFTLPATLASGSYTVLVTVHDGDGDVDQWSWPVTVGSTTKGAKHTSCGGGFNGASVHHGDTLWFSSVLKVGGLPANGATITFTGQTITVGGTTISVPDSRVVFSRTAKQATTTFDDGTWVTVVPVGLGGNVFLSGVGYQLASDLRGGQNATWSGTMSSDTPGVSVNWQWGAAAYTSFGTSPGEFGVKPVDDNRSSNWQNSDHAGTPEGWSRHVKGGGTGGGGTTSLGF